MNDHELELALGAIGKERTQVAAPPVLRERVRAVPVETPQQRSWPLRIDTRGIHMFSVLKYLAAGVIVALFGGFLLAGVLLTRLGIRGARWGLKLRHTGFIDAMWEALTDPVCGQGMGMTAESLAKMYAIGREEQDAFALESQRRAAAAGSAPSS